MKTDSELARGMAEDIANAINFFGDGSGFCTPELLHIYLDTSVAAAGEYPCECNYNDNCTLGVWTWFDPAERYNIDYPAFDEALEAKLPGFEFTDPEESENSDASVTLADCIKLFDALDGIYAEAIKIVHEWIDNEPEKHFAKVMENAFAKEK